MAGNTHYYLHLHDAHGRGKVGVTGGTRPPRSLGHYEFYITYIDDAGGYTPRIGQRVEVINSGETHAPAGRVVAVNLVAGAAGQLGEVTVEIATGSERLSALWGAVGPAVSAAQHVSYTWPTDIGDILPPSGTKSLRFVDPGGNVDCYVAAVHHSRHSYPRMSNDKRLLECVPADRVEGIWWDPAAAKGGYLDIDSGYTGALYRGEVVTASGGSSFTFLHPETIGGGNLRIWYCDLQGTAPAVSETLSSTSAGGTWNATVTGSGEPPQATPGAWVPYCAVPHLGLDLYYDALSEAENTSIYFSRWAKPPRGNALRGETALIGPENRIIKRAYDLHQGSTPATDDKSMRWLSFSCLDEAGTLNVGGIFYQCIAVTGASGWGGVAVGATITSSAGAWTGKYAGINAAATRIFVYGTNGETLAAGTLTSGGATATNSGAAEGWQKGAKHWNALVAQITAARAADGALYPGSTEKWERVFIQSWEGEIGVMAAGLVPFFLTTEQHYQEFARFVNDLRALLAAPDVPIILWSHKSSLVDGEGSQFSVKIGGVLPAAAWLEGMYLECAGRSAGAVKFVGSQGLEMEWGDSLATLDGWKNTGLYLSTLSYLEVGERLWAAAVTNITSPPSEDFEPMPIIVVTGQSQILGFNVAPATDLDPELYLTASFPASGGTVDTSDPNVITWDAINQIIARYDCKATANTFWGGSTGNHGSEAPIVARARRRWPKVAVFKAAVSGSCISPNVPNQAGCWHPTAIRPAVTTSVDITSDALAGTTTFTAVAGAGTFSSLLALLGGGTLDGSVVVSGGATTQAMGGYNTNPYQRNLVPVASYDATGASITISGVLTPASGVSLTFTGGPPLIYSTFRSEWKKFVAALADEGYVARPVAFIRESGEGDFDDADNFAANLEEFWDAMIALCSLRTTADQDLVKVEVQVHSGTPLGTDDQLATVRAAQAAQVAAMPNGVLVDPSRLAMEIKEGGSPPLIRLVRQDNGVHHTTRSMITKGFLIDQAMNGKIGIPPHPTGSAEVLFGAPQLLPFASSAGGDDDGGEDAGGGEEDSGGGGDFAPTAEQETELATAMYDSPDIASYTTATGASVTRRTVDELLKLERNAREQAARARGLRQTKVRFH